MFFLGSFKMAASHIPFYRDIFAAESKGELKILGDCTIGLCDKPGIVAFGEWVLCRDHAKVYLRLRREWGAKNAPISED